MIDPDKDEILVKFYSIWDVRKAMKRFRFKDTWPIRHVDSLDYVITETQLKMIEGLKLGYSLACPRPPPPRPAANN